MSAMDRSYKQFMQNNELFIHKKRTKWAPFEFIGSLYNILFGMMDAGFEPSDRKANFASWLYNNNLKLVYNQLKLISSQVKDELDEQRVALFFAVMSSQLNLIIDECHDI